MSALSRRVVALVVVLVAMIASSAAQGIGVVSGRVRDERDHALKHVIVTLRGPAVPGVMRTTTDAGGRYRFPAVPGNHPFDIKAMVDGRVPVQYIGHTVRRNGSLAIDFKLRKPGDHVVLILLDDGVPYHELALRGALTTMPGSSSLLRIKRTSRRIVKALRARLDARPSAVLAIGDRAARLARRYVKDVPIVHTMVPAPLDSDLTTANMCGVPLNGGFTAQIDRLRRAVPAARRIGALYDPHRMGRSMRELREAAERSGLELVAENVRGGLTGGIEGALSELGRQDLDAFLLLLDPEVLDTRRFAEILDLVRRQDLLLVVPDASLAVSGKSLQIAPGFWQLGAYSGMLIRRILEGEVQPSQIGMTYPETITLAGNPVMSHPPTPADVLPGGRPSRAVRLALED